MRILIIGLVLTINFLFQTTALQSLALRGILPNTAVILIVSYALLRGKTEGMLAGLFAGLLHDIFFGASFGYYALLGMATGYLAGGSHHSFYRENYIMPVMLCTLGVFLYETSVYVLGFFFHGEMHFPYFLASVILPAAVYSALWTIPLYRLLFGINEWLELREKYKHRLF